MKHALALTLIALTFGPTPDAAAGPLRGSTNATQRPLITIGQNARPHLAGVEFAPSGMTLAGQRGVLEYARRGHQQFEFTVSLGERAIHLQLDLSRFGNQHALDVEATSPPFQGWFKAWRAQRWLGRLRLIEPGHVRAFTHEALRLQPGRRNRLAGSPILVRQPTQLVLRSHVLGNLDEISNRANHLLGVYVALLDLREPGGGDR